MIQNNANDLQLNIDSKHLKPLFQTKVYRHVLAMLGDWLIIALTIGLCIQYFHPLTYLLAILIIGARMHALAILMHDATHYRFLKNRQWNDTLTNWFTMYPIFTSIETYRENHLRHHRHLNTEDDPDWVAKLGKRAFTFPKSKSEFLITVFSYFTLYQGISDAIWFLKRFGGAKDGEKKKAKSSIDRPIFYLLLFVSLTLIGAWKYFLLFWVVPYLSTFFMYQYIRSVAEHFGELAYDHLLTSTRTVKPNWLERFFIAPHHVGYHLEHHLYPGVPFYHLPQLHTLLMREQGYSEKAHVTQGYVMGLMEELGGAEYRDSEIGLG
ncbi:MAG: fatty acid desaturase family protein [Bacteroidota bacterium]